jgi:hypothetical protein
MPKRSSNSSNHHSKKRGIMKSPKSPKSLGQTSAISAYSANSISSPNIIMPYHLTLPGANAMEMNTVEMHQIDQRGRRAHRRRTRRGQRRTARRLARNGMVGI